MKNKKSLSELNTAAFLDTKTATTVRTWKVKGGTCTLRQRRSGKWEAEFAADRDDRYTVVLASTPARAIKRLRINTTPVAA